jgi:hypothetical protein
LIFATSETFEERDNNESTRRTESSAWSAACASAAESRPQAATLKIPPIASQVRATVGGDAAERHPASANAAATTKAWRPACTHARPAGIAKAIV